MNAEESASHLQGSPDDLQDRITDLEAKLIEQEHRPTHILLNFFRRNELFPQKDDPRRLAVSKALIFRLVFSPAAAGGGLALLSAAILIWHGWLLHTNNEVAERSNKQLFESNRLLAQQVSEPTQAFAEMLSLDLLDGNERGRLLKGTFVILNSGKQPIQLTRFFGTSTKDGRTQMIRLDHVRQPDEPKSENHAVGNFLPHLFTDSLGPERPVICEPRSFRQVDVHWQVPDYDDIEDWVLRDSFSDALPTNAYRADWLMCLGIEARTITNETIGTCFVVAVSTPVEEQALPGSGRFKLDQLRDRMATRPEKITVVYPRQAELIKNVMLHQNEVLRQAKESPEG